MRLAFIFAFILLQTHSVFAKSKEDDLDDSIAQVQRDLSDSTARKAMARDS